MGIGSCFFFVHLMQSVPCVTVGSMLALVYFLSFYNVAGQELFLIFNNNATDGNKKVIYLLISSIWSAWEKEQVTCPPRDCLPFCCHSLYSAKGHRAPTNHIEFLQVNNFWNKLSWIFPRVHHNVVDFKVETQWVAQDCRITFPPEARGI